MTKLEFKGIVTGFSVNITRGSEPVYSIILDGKEQTIPAGAQATITWDKKAVKNPSKNEEAGEKGFFIP